MSVQFFAQIQSRSFVYTPGRMQLCEGHLPPYIFSYFPCRHVMSALASETVSPNAEHAVTITVILYSPPCDCDKMTASSAYSIPHNLCASSSPSSSFPPRPSTLPARGLLFLCPFSFFLVAVTCCPWRPHQRAQYRREKHDEQQWGDHTPSPKTLPHVDLIQALPVIQSHACLNAIVELADDGEHSRWHVNSSKDSPQKESVDGVI